MTHNRRLHILFIPSWYPRNENKRDGIFIVHHAKAIQRLHDVTVLFPYDEPFDPAESVKVKDEFGIPTIRIPYAINPIPGVTFVRNLYAQYRALRNIIKNNRKPDIIHAHVFDAGLPAVILGKLLNIPVVLTEHSSVFTRDRLGTLNKLKAKFVMRSVRAVMPVSETLRSSLEHYTSDTDMHVIPNAIDTSLFNAQTKSTASETVRILSITNMRPVKGVDDLLNSLSSITKKRTDFMIDIVGDGPALEDYKKLSHNLGLDKNVRFHGALSQQRIIELLHNCNFFVQASHSETFGVVYVEAMSCGKPVIGTTLPTLTEKISTERGILVPPKDTKALSDAIYTMMNTYANYSAKKIVQYVQQTFSYDAVGKQINEIYKTILNKKGSVRHDKKVLIVTYTFPPNAGGGAQRTTKFAKYLPANGWQPIILTVKKNINKNQDLSLLKDIPPEAVVHRTRFSSPQSIFFKLFGRDAAKKKNFNSVQGITIYICEKIVNAINALLLIPDQTILWFPRAYFKAKKIIENEKPDIIFSSSLPPTTHIIAYFLKKKFSIPWVADFRDEWTQNPFVHYFTPFHRYINTHIEKKILQQANIVTTVSNPWRDGLASLIHDSKKIVTIMNGYDHADFQNLKTKKENNEVFTISYVGSIYGDQSPRSFLTALSQLVTSNDIDARKISVRFIGGVAGTELSKIPDKIKPCISIEGYTEHSKAVQLLYKSDALLLFISNSRGTGCYTAKIYEYIATGKPILALVPTEGVAAQLVRRINAGTVVNPDSKDEIKKALLSLYAKWMGGSLRSSTQLNTINEFSRIELTKQLASLFNTLIQKNEKHGSS